MWAGEETVWGWWERFGGGGGNGLRGRGGNGCGMGDGGSRLGMDVGMGDGGKGLVPMCVFGSHPAGLSVCRRSL